ncbi:MAG: coenzyme F420-0:L-glutamate ligase [Chloroflexi bacterium]|nr:coenzyme F420-0:L-glutamate ligase [Chloroflexota bacterium]
MTDAQNQTRFPEFRVIGITGVPEIQVGDDLPGIILAAAEGQGTPVEDGDIVVVTQKVVSKAEGALVNLADVEPSPLALTIAGEMKDPRHVEVVLRESRRIVRMERGVLITETHHGLICANAGVDASNVTGDDVLCLLPKDPDASARRIRDAVRERAGRTVAVIISDTFGRPWRVGTTDIAIGCAGIAPLKDYRGMVDRDGRTLQVSVAAVADEAAGAAELVTRKTIGVPVTIVRGLPYDVSEEGADVIIREASMDLFR